jgi:Flp pilus assembly protein TadG
MTSACASRDRRGSALFEFALVCVLLMLTVLAGVEFDRMVLVYTTIANSARAGVRYAIVNGSDSTTVPDVKKVVTNFASAGLLTTGNLIITVSYPDTATSRTDCAGSTSPGCLVTVSVSYPYDPFVVLPLHVTLSSTTQGIITF